MELTAATVDAARPFAPSVTAWNGVPWGCLMAGIVLGLVRPAALETAGLYLWAASIVVLGVPHGACDPLVLPRLLCRRWALRATILFYVAYLCAAGLVVLLWVVSPLAGLLFFLGLTVWHWGTADAIARARTHLWYVAGGLARGLLVIAGPFAFHPVESTAMFTQLVGVVGPSSSGTRMIVLTHVGSVVDGVRGLMACAVLVELAGIIHDLRHREVSRAAAAALDLALLLILYRLVPPVTAVALYFTTWHSWRHVLRVGSLLEDSTVSAQRLVARYYARAWPLTIVSAAGLALVMFVLRRHGLPDLIATYLVLISAVTLPHALVVAAWDRGARYAAWRQPPVTSVAAQA